jgi:hypothetical protein
MDARVNRPRPSGRRARNVSQRRTQAWRRDREASIARAQARKRGRLDELPTGEAALMLREAEAARALVTQLGPSARSWALATKAADLERRAFTADPTLRPGWAS